MLSSKLIISAFMLYMYRYQYEFHTIKRFPHKNVTFLKKCDKSDTSLSIKQLFSFWTCFVPYSWKVPGIFYPHIYVNSSWWFRDWFGREKTDSWNDQIHISEMTECVMLCVFIVWTSEHVFWCDSNFIPSSLC